MNVISDINPASQPMPTQASNQPSGPPPLNANGQMQTGLSLPPVAPVASATPVSEPSTTPVLQPSSVSTTMIQGQPSPPLPNPPMTSQALPLAPTSQPTLAPAPLAVPPVQNGDQHKIVANVNQTTDGSAFHTKHKDKKHDEHKIKNKIALGGPVANPVFLPIAIACVATVLLMSLTILTYAKQDTDKKNTQVSSQQNDSVAPTLTLAPLSESDIDGTLRYIDQKTAELERTDVPTEDDLSNELLGL